MKRVGWTNFIERNNSKLIPMAIERGAEYLIINDSSLLDHEDLQPYLYHQLGQFRNTYIFKLKNLPGDSL